MMYKGVTGFGLRPSGMKNQSSPVHQQYHYYSDDSVNILSAATEAAVLSMSVYRLDSHWRYPGFSLQHKHKRPTLSLVQYNNVPGLHGTPATERILWC